MDKATSKRGLDSGTHQDRANALKANQGVRDANKWASPWFPMGTKRLENSRLEAHRGETAYSCRKTLQALLGFFIALLGAASLNGGW
ncbi:hypothetical protein G5I_03083 [Acromyrmex echinatior]|uniref:Uncharacterized protein n=1 Tax=Acromyrmex echinatior TaxID=103372 RepID=F4WC12_ACREC|nr:hypothetical protein G5I_03083 [Acromyrmex echinatior]